MSPFIGTDVLIVGGGIVGGSAALALRRKGLQVVLVERDFCGSRSSGINFGGVRRQGRPLSQLPLAQRAHEIWGRLGEHIGIDGEYQRCGHLKLARTEAEMQALVQYEQRTQGHGLGLEIIGQNALRQRFPGLGADVVGGSLCPEDGQANPRLVAPAFARAARALGAQVFEQSAMRSVAFDGSRFVVETAQGLTIKAEVVLNSAGAWSGGLAAQFGDTVDMVSRHPSMAVTEPLPFMLPWSLGVEGGNIYCRQVARGNLVFGGGLGQAVDADRARAQSATLLSQFSRIAQIVPAFAGASVLRTWSGAEGYLPDKLPVMGASRHQPGLFHAFGFAGAGFQIGPAVGEVMAELIATGSTSTPIDAFSLQRFPAPSPSKGLPHDHST
ncbi:MAG: FAD-binding oxidoreductase [Comamonas sp.]